MRALLRPTGWPAGAIFGCIAPFWFACSSDPSESVAPYNPGNSGGTPSMNALELSFEGTPIQVAPRSDTKITVRVRPAAAYSVRFSLLDSPSAPSLGAALSRGEVVSGADGRASVVLSAPDSPTNFELRAQVDSYFVSTTVSVEAGALTSLNVSPNYKGVRSISEWVASVHPSMRCSDFSGAVPDGPYLMRAAPSQPLRLADVPAAAPLAVVLRSGGLARGCTTIEKPTPNGDTNVSVNVSDVPIDLAQTVLELVFGIDAQERAIKADLQGGAALVQATLRRSADSDVSAVLDAMDAQLSASQRRTFRAARSVAAWDTSATQALGRGAATRLGDALTRWARDSQSALFSERALEASISSNATDASIPALVPERMAGVSTEVIDVGASGGVWSADPLDTLAFSASISWPAAALSCSISSGPARAETGQADLASALAQLLSCVALGAELANEPSWGAGCDATCSADLCTRALGTVLANACAASTQDRTTLSVLATSSAHVNDLAQADTIQGSWVGRLTHGLEQGETGGSLRGSRPRSVP
ncbi:MAG: hypothetical protein QM756_13140 [Polyangiaceae bacterium]